LNKKNKAKLVEVDPLYSGTAKNFEEEKTTLDAKYRDCRQRFLSIQSNLYYVKPDAFSEERDNIYKKIEEAVNFAKTNRKRIEDLDTRTKKSIETTSETLQKEYTEEIQKCKTEILEILKNAKLGGSSVDDATIQSIR
jgi:DNA anti-recombination protein RmuC